MARVGRRHPLRRSPPPRRALFDQYGRPTADSAAASWTTAPLFSKVDENPSDDADSISSETLGVAGTTSIAKLTVGTLTDPTTSVGHILRVRYKATFTLGTTATGFVELRQSGTLVATLNTGPLTTAFAPYLYTLSAAEADAITDYAALELWLYGTFGVGNLGGVQVAWVEFEIPIATAAGGGPVTGTGAGAATSSGTAIGTPTISGTATGAATGSGVATGLRTVSGTGTGAGTATGTATSTRTVLGTAVGASTSSGTAAGIGGKFGVATGASTSSGTAIGTPTVLGIGTGAATATGTASGLRTISGTANGAATSSGEASGSGGGGTPVGVTPISVPGGRNIRDESEAFYRARLRKEDDEILLLV